MVEEALRCTTCGLSVHVERDGAVCDDGHRFDVAEGVVLMVDDSLLERDPQYAGQRRYFDAEFGTYRRYELESWRRSYLDRLRAGGLLDGGPLVDVGVGGSGYTVIEAARTGSPAAGCDLSLAGLTAARGFARSERVSDRTLWVCCSAERLPFASGTFAAAVAIAVFEHVPDDGAAFAELARVLMPGGRAWVTVPHALRHITPLLRRPNRRHDRRMGHLRRYEAEQLVAQGEAVGLRVLDVQFTGHSLKALQLATNRFWWQIERHDLRRAHVRRGAMQLSALFERGA